MSRVKLVTNSANAQSTVFIAVLKCLRDIQVDCILMATYFTFEFSLKLHTYSDISYRFLPCSSQSVTYWECVNRFWQLACI